MISGVNFNFDENGMQFSGSEKALPTIVVGLGDSGTFVVHHAISHIDSHQLDLDPVKFVCINTDGCNDTSRTTRAVYLNMKESADPYLGNQREEMPEMFRRAAHYNDLRQFINANLQNQVEKHNVVIISSIAEEEAAIIGDVLYLINHAVGNNIQHQISLFLALDAPEYSRKIHPDQQFALLREISRFRKHARHVFGLDNERILERMLFHLYFIFGSEQFVSRMEFEDGFIYVTGPTISRFLQLYLDPSYESVFENLLTQLHSSNGQPTLLDKCGSASIFSSGIPYYGIKRLLAVQILKYFLLRESNDFTALSNMDTTASPQEIEKDVADWFISSTIDGKRLLPIISANTEDFIVINHLSELRSNYNLFRDIILENFQNKIDRGFSAPIFIDLENTFIFLLKKIVMHINAAGNKYREDPNHKWQDQRRLLTDCKKLVQAILKEIKNWNELFISETQDDLFSDIDAFGVNKEAFSDRLENKLSHTKKYLLKHDGISRFRISDTEVNSFVANQLERFVGVYGAGEEGVLATLNNYSHGFVDNSPMGIKLKLCFGRGENKEIYTYSQPKKILDHLLGFIMNNLGDLEFEEFNFSEPDLTHLRRSEKPAFRIEQEAVTFQPISSSDFLISDPSVRNNELGNELFDDLAADNRMQILNRKENYWITALRIFKNISVKNISVIRELQQEYRPNMKLHISKQEKSASEIEKKLRLVDKEFRFIPEIVLALYDQELVELFLESVILGVIQPRTDNSGRKMITLVLPESHWYKSLEIVPNEPDSSIEKSLFTALKTFALDMPYDQKKNIEHGGHPFNPSNRDGFLNEIRTEIEKIKKDNNLRAICENFWHSLNGAKRELSNLENGMRMLVAYQIGNMLGAEVDLREIIMDRNGEN
jgi:hypothetical protein